MPLETSNRELGAIGEIAQPYGQSSSSDPQSSQDPEIDLIDALTVLAKHKKTVATIVFFFSLIAGVVLWLLPNYYTAETSILPPQQSQSIASSMLGQFAPLASLAGKDLGLKNPSDMYVALLQSRTVADSLIQRFNLEEVYGTKRLSDTREQLASRSKISSGKDGLIVIAVEDKSPKRAASIANGYSEELYKLNQQLAITEASQRRLFFANELKAAKDELATAEVELKKTQEATGLIQLDSQAKAIIESVAAVNGQIAAKEVQLRSMQSFATDQNPDYRRVLEELTALRSQLAKLQQSPNVGNGDIMVPTGKVPGAGLEYLRKLRDVKYYETIFEVLAKQYEVAKIDEARTAPVLQVVDVAVEPDRHSKPKRLLMVALASILGVFVAVLWVFLHESYRRVLSDGSSLEKIRVLRSYLFSRYSPS